MFKNLVFWVGWISPVDLLMHSDVITYAIFCVPGMTSNEIFNHSTRKNVLVFLFGSVLKTLVG